MPKWEATPTTSVTTDMNAAMTELLDDQMAKTLEKSIPYDSGKSPVTSTEMLKKIFAHLEQPVKWENPVLDKQKIKDLFTEALIDVDRPWFDVFYQSLEKSAYHHGFREKHLKFVPIEAPEDVDVVTRTKCGGKFVMLELHFENKVYSLNNYACDLYDGEIGVEGDDFEISI